MSLNNISNLNNNTTPSPIIVKLLWRQQQELLTKFPDCVKIIINHEDPLDIQAEIFGPKETPYEGGVFRVKIIVGSDFPYTAPKGIFMTKIYHPNVSEKGEICVNTLKKDWNPKGWSLFNVFEVIKCLLIIPFPESSLNEEAGKLFMENYNEYFKIASIFTQVYARPQDNQITTETNFLNPQNFNEIKDCHVGENFVPHEVENNISSLKYKSWSSEINYENSSNYNNNFTNTPNTNGKLDYELLSRNHSKSLSMKHNQSMFKSKNSVLMLNRKSSNFSNGDTSFLINKPNINSLPFILRSNSFCNNENVNLVMSQNSNLNVFNFQTPNPTPTRSKKDEIKKWLSRI